MTLHNLKPHQCLYESIIEKNSAQPKAGQKGID